MRWLTVVTGATLVCGGATATPTISAAQERPFSGRLRVGTAQPPGSESRA